jgi:hypothetical protein
MSKATELFEEAFRGPRDPRSDEYKAGVLSCLMFRFGEVDSVTCPYPLGTASADAYFAGCSEGHTIYRNATGKYP